MLGIFRLVFPVYMIALTLSVAGVPLAISKLIAELHEKNDQTELPNYLLQHLLLSNIWSAWIFSYYDWIEYVCKYAWWTRYETPINCHFVCVINRTVYGGISRVFPRFWRYDSYRGVTSN